MNYTLTPNTKSWLTYEKDSDFPIQNIPFGVCIFSGKRTGLASVIGDCTIDLTGLFDLGVFENINVDRSVFENNYLNDFIDLGKEKTNKIRLRIAEIFDLNNQSHFEHTISQAKILYSCDQVQMLLPIKIGDYTDFYASKDHATNVGKMFRDPDNALLPNWLHLPVAYHGRASSVVVSKTNIHRPKGQILPKGMDTPIYSESKLMDFELEMAFVLRGNTKLGDSISADKAEENIFGLLIFNDWSARDIQKWEYVPLGPFLGKNFASSVSPWVVCIEALEDFRCDGPEQVPAPLEYLGSNKNSAFDIKLEVDLSYDDVNYHTICRSNFANLYWTMPQMLAHHTVNGCNINTGDLIASGTISGKDQDSFGSMLELSWGGSKEIKVGEQTRKFLLDGDTVRMRAFAQNKNIRIGFGSVESKLLASKNN